MSEFLTFPELVRRHLALLAKADEVVRAANEARRETLRDAGRAGVNPTLLKIVAKEKQFDQEALDELATMREAAFEETELAKAAARAEAARAKARAAEEEETDEDETWAQPEEETDELV
jgi:hypothetical protein